MPVFDMHSHILPGIDDGAPAMDEAVEMAQAARRAGIDVVVATPHGFRDPFNVTTAQRDAALAELREGLIQNQVDLCVLPGMECHLVSDLQDHLRSDPGLLLDRGTGSFLLELPDELIPPGLEEFLFEMKMHGLLPLIAHPERNVVLQQKPALVRSLVEEGVRLQITAGSLFGVYGWRCKHAALRWLKKGWVHVVASDAHAPEGYAEFGRAMDHIRHRYGAETANSLFSSYPAALLGYRSAVPSP